MIDMLEQGTLDRILRKWQPPEADCEPLRRTGKSMKFEKLISLFVIVIIGIFLAAITFVLENVFDLMNNSGIADPPISNNDKLILKLKSALKDVDVRLNANYSVDISLIKVIDSIYNEINTRDELSHGPSQNLAGGLSVFSCPDKPNPNLSKHALARAKKFLAMQIRDKKCAKSEEN